MQDRLYADESQQSDSGFCARTYARARPPRVPASSDTLYSCADIAEFAAGPRSKSEEAEGIVKYPTARAPSEASSVADGVVDYPAVAGAAPGPGSSEEGRPRQDLTGPDGLGDPSDWDPPPREIPYAGPRGGGGAAGQQPPGRGPARHSAAEPVRILLAKAALLRSNHSGYLLL